MSNYLENQSSFGTIVPVTDSRAQEQTIVVSTSVNNLELPPQAAGSQIGEQGILRQLIKTTIQAKSDLDETGRTRRFALLSYYTDNNIFKILNSLHQYHLNTWSVVYDKAIFIADRLHQTPYFTHIANNIEIDKVYSMDEIIPFIARTRKSFNLEPYKKNSVKQSIQDFLQIHLAEIVYSDYMDKKTGRPVIEGYKPIFNLDCQI